MSESKNGIKRIKVWKRGQGRIGMEGRALYKKKVMRNQMVI